MNLMAVDGQKIQDACSWGNLLWEVPVMTVVSYHENGYSSLVRKLIRFRNGNKMLLKIQELQLQLNTYK